MKKSNFFKTVLGVAAAMLISSGVFGQVANSDYTVYDATLIGPSNIDYVTFKTGGTTMGYYALPDPVYHPNYKDNAVGADWVLTAGFTWVWTRPAGVNDVTPGGQPANYVELQYTAPATYNITVAESTPAAWGACPDATPTEMTVNVIAAPTAVITTADPASQLCGNSAAVPVGLSFTEVVPAGIAGFAFAVTEVVDNIDGAGNLIANVSTTADFVDFPISGKLNTGNGLLGAGPFTYSFNTSALNIQGANRTRYTYTLVKATDAADPDQGVISAISEKSDYLAIAAGGNPNTYAFGAKTTFVVIVNPAPATGPIYYVPNNFAY